MSKTTYIVAVVDAEGAPDLLIGPFGDMDAATKYMEEKDVFLADAERDLIEAERRAHPEREYTGAVDTVVMVVNSPDEIFVEVK